jgi:hypothetical protein
VTLLSTAPVRDLVGELGLTDGIAHYRRVELSPG